MKGRPQKPPEQYMQAIVIGGPANGMILSKVLVTAKKIELARPEHVKPLESSGQQVPDVEMTKCTYQVCTIMLDQGDGRFTPFGLVVEEGKPMIWAFSELVRGFAQNVINETKAENLKP